MSEDVPTLRTCGARLGTINGVTMYCDASADHPPGACSVRLTEWIRIPDGGRSAIRSENETLRLALKLHENCDAEEALRKATISRLREALKEIGDGCQWMGRHFPAKRVLAIVTAALSSTPETKPEQSEEGKP